MAADALGAAIKMLAHGQSLALPIAMDAFRVVMGGNAAPEQIAALLMALRVKGETPDEVAAVALVLREAMRRVDARDPAALVDTCGTGGGVVGTFNISTASALVAAGAGVRIAKHGNRSFTSICGSADVLEALGVSIELPAERLAGVLDEAGIVFMFAPTMHPAMRHVGPVRRVLGVPTIMNIVGPLANPAGALRQVVGVADRGRMMLLANALNQLGAIHALVVHGEPGIDELSPMGLTHVVEVRGGTLREWTIAPETLGLAPADAESLAGGDPASNAALIVEILNGGAAEGARSAVLLNAAAAIYVSGAAPDLPAALRLARESIASGGASAALARLRTAAHP